MFTKQDYESYFEQIRYIEAKMLKEVSELLKIIKDKKMKSVLEKIKEDELEHKEIVKEILALIKNL